MALVAAAAAAVAAVAAAAVAWEDRPPRTPMISVYAGIIGSFLFFRLIIIR